MGRVASVADAAELEPHGGRLHGGCVVMGQRVLHFVLEPAPHGNGLTAVNNARASG